MTSLYTANKMCYVLLLAKYMVITTA